jgi:hypothetical protein
MLFHNARHCVVPLDLDLQIYSSCGSTDPHIVILKAFFQRYVVVVIVLFLVMAL